MRIRVLFFILFLLSIRNSEAQIPAFGQSRYCDLASWNLYWFGDAQYGPSDKKKQAGAIGEVLRNAKIDIWFFQEIVDTSSFSDQLSLNGNFGHVYARYWQSQKTAWVWNTAEWEYISDSMILDPYSADFANGRLPLYCGLRSKKTGDTLHLVGIHLKAHTGDDAAKHKAWKSRGRAVLHLQNWVSSFSDKQVVIAGDWNDDIDKSIYQDSLSPLLPLKEEGTFLLESFSWAGAHSWYYGQEMIDHIWVNDRLSHFYKEKSAKLLPIDLYFADYPNTISDHFPVFASFSFQPNAVDDLKQMEFKLYPNPTNDWIRIEAGFEISRIEVFDIQGNIVNEVFPHQQKFDWKPLLPEGVYVLRVHGGEVPLIRRLVLSP